MGDSTPALPPVPVPTIPGDPTATGTSVSSLVPYVAIGGLLYFLLLRKKRRRNPNKWSEGWSRPDYSPATGDWVFPKKEHAYREGGAEARDRAKFRRKRSR
jgi:hypothetical protein